MLMMMTMTPPPATYCCTCNTVDLVAICHKIELKLTRSATPSPTDKANKDAKTSNATSPNDDNVIDAADDDVKDPNNNTELAYG